MEHPALHWKALPNKSIQCRLCSQFCLIKEGENGFCRVRKNAKGKLLSLSYGNACGISIDPIEKKPFFHFRPGSSCLSFGTPGCNFACLGCQNWELSQEPRLVAEAELKSVQLDKSRDSRWQGPRIEPVKGENPSSERAVRPKEIVALAKGTDGIAYTYSEPTIFYEYVRDCAKLAKRRGLYNALVSNGFFSPELADELSKEKLFDAIRIDYKFPDNESYLKYCGARKKPVVGNIKKIFESGIHLEVINLVIPGLNDSEKSLGKTARKIAGIDPEIPVHFSRFHPDYSFGGIPTPKETLLLAGKIAAKCGLKHVYLGNAPDIPGGENAFCAGCGALLIERRGFFVSKNLLNKWGRCPECGKKLRGVFS